MERKQSDRSVETIERVAVLIDGPNFYMMAQYLGIQIDYFRFVYTITLGRKAVIKNVYCQPSESLKRKNFYRNLNKKYHLDVFECDEGDDVDEILADDLRRIAQREGVDTIILVSGDGGYFDALNYAHHECGKKIEIVSIGEMLGRKYFGNGFEIIDLKNLKQFVVEESFQQVRRNQEKRQKHKRNNSKTEQNRYYGTRRRKNNFRYKT